MQSFPAQITMIELLTAQVLAQRMWQDFWLARRALIILECVFKLLEAWVLVPVLALILSATLAYAGHVAVSNRDVLDFLLSPFGILFATLFGTATLAMLLLEQAGVMVIVDCSTRDEHQLINPVGVANNLNPLRVLQLSAVMVFVLALMVLPFVGCGLLTYHFLLTQHDINYYLAERPPVFWVASCVGGLLLVVFLVLVMTLFVRWSFALPILLFERTTVLVALRESRASIRGVGWSYSVYLFGWLFGTTLLGSAAAYGFRQLAAAILDQAGDYPIVQILLLLLAQAAVLTISSFITITGQGLLTRQLYLFRSQQLGRGSGRVPSPSNPDKTVPAWSKYPLVVFLCFVGFAPLGIWANLSHYLGDRPVVRVTAHRGHSLAAPENTISAVRKAIESGADYAEVDVQLTADGVVVLLHDRDLKRVAGIAQRLEEVSWEQLRQLDVGSWFGPGFVGERVPTLAEVIDLARGRIKLNIELKLFGDDRRLAREVARLVSEKRFESDCIITTFHYDAILEMKQQNPKLRTGLIVAHALGDLSRLEVDVLSVRADWLTEKVLRAAHRAKKEVHVWTVNDGRKMTQLMKQGADNLITDDPDLAIRTRNAWTNLSRNERLVTTARLLLGNYQ